MIAAIIVLGLLVVAETLFIFWLLGVLKNTFSIVEDMSDFAQGRTPRSFKEAYDGKYYPATVIAQLKFNSPEEMSITDFSLYESKKIIGFTIYTTESIRDYYGAAVDELSDEELELIFENKPAIFKNSVVYAPREGIWTWKSAD